MKLFYLENLVSTGVIPLDVMPWDPSWENPPPIKGGKDGYRDPSTRSFFLSACEGMNSAKRVTAEDGDDGNPVALIHGLITDHDSLGDVDELISRLRKCAEHPIDSKKLKYAPLAVGSSLSRGIKMLWQFEKPVDVRGRSDVASNFMSRVLGKLDSHGLHGKVDVTCAKPSQYQHWGRDRWTTVPDLGIPNVVPYDFLLTQLAESYRIMGRKTTSGDYPPLSEIHERAVEVFGAEAVGVTEFTLGTKTTLFWDPADDGHNRQAAVVHEDGMFCFSSRGENKEGKPFLRWEEIFGSHAGFITARRETEYGKIMQKYFVCSEGYWYRSAPRQRWKRLQQGMVVSQLKTAGLSGDREKGSKSCEIDRFVASMVEMRFADDQAPFFFDSRECVTQGDRTILNLWSRPPFWFDTQPDSGVVPERDFPFLWSIINMWDDVPFDGIHPANWLIEWLRREVLQMLAMKGLGFTHAIVLSGPVGSGKTLFLNAVLGALYGVSQIPGAEEYLKGSNFNAKLMQSPVWGLDDGVPALKNETRVNIQARLKKLVASTTVTFEAKGVDAIDVDMHPRILLCCNSERMASTVVPTIDPSTEDKFVFLKVDPKKKVQFYPTKHENKARIEHEIPYLVAWLLAREPDPTVVRNNRCGMGVYRHPEVEAASRSNVEGGVSDEEISERVWIYMEGFGDSQDKKNHPGDFNPTKRRRSVFATELRSFLEQRDMSVELRLPGSMLKHSLTVSNTLCEKAKQYTQRMQEDPDFVPPITITRQGNRDRLHFYLDSPYFRTHNKHLPDDNRPF